MSFLNKVGKLILGAICGAAVSYVACKAIDRKMHKANIEKHRKSLFEKTEKHLQSQLEKYCLYADICSKKFGNADIAIIQKEVMKPMTEIAVENNSYDIRYCMRHYSTDHHGAFLQATKIPYLEYYKDFLEIKDAEFMKKITQIEKIQADVCKGIKPKYAFKIDPKFTKEIAFKMYKYLICMLVYISTAYYFLKVSF